MDEVRAVLQVAASNEVNGNHSFLQYGEKTTLDGPGQQTGGRPGGAPRRMKTLRCLARYRRSRCLRRHHVFAMTRLALGLRRSSALTSPLSRRRSTTSGTVAARSAYVGSSPESPCDIFIGEPDHLPLECGVPCARRWSSSQAWRRPCKAPGITPCDGYLSIHLYFWLAANHLTSLRERRVVG